MAGGWLGCTRGGGEEGSRWGVVVVVWMAEVEEEMEWAEGCLGAVIVFVGRGSGR